MKEPTAETMPDPRPDELAVHAEFLRCLAGSLLRSPDLAEDAVQETLVLTWRKRPRVASLPAWMAGALRNVVRNQRRADQRRAARHAALRDERSSHTPEAILEREETRRRLLEAIFRLPDAERDVVLLRYSRDLPPRRVASELGIAPHTVHNRLRSGLARMRRDLDGVHGGDGIAWRRSLSAFIPSLPSPDAPVGLGGLLMGKKLAVLAATLLLLGLVTWQSWVPHADDTPQWDADSATLAASDADGGTAVTGPVLETASVEAPAVRVPEAAVERRLFGRVLDPQTKRPVVGVRVVAFDYERLETRETRTDADGRFEFPSARGRTGAFHLVIDHPEHARHVAGGTVPSTQGLTIQRQPGGFIAGRLVDADGAAVPRFRVTAIRRRFQPGDPVDGDAQMAHAILPTAFTADRVADFDDAEGRFRIGPLRDGVHALVIDAPSHTLRFEAAGARSYEDDKGIEVQADATHDVGTIKLGALGTFALKVVDAETEAVLEGASIVTQVEVDGRRYEKSVDTSRRAQDGAYLVPVELTAEGRYESVKLNVMREGYSPHALSMSGQKNGSAITMRLDRTANLHATVLRPDGKPAAGAVALIRRDNNRMVVNQQSLDSAGRLVAEDLPAGAHLELLVLDAASLSVVVVLPLYFRPGEVRTMTVGGPDQAAFAGVLRIRGQPVQRALVTLDSPDGRRTQDWTSADGGFRFDGLLPGPHEVTIAMDAPDVTLRSDVRIERGVVTEVDLDLRHDVRGSFGEPPAADEVVSVDVPGIEARAIASEGALRWRVHVPSAEDGTFTVPFPVAGTYEVHSDDPDFRIPDPPQVTVGAGVENELLIIHVEVDPRDGELEIRVVDAETEALLEDASFRRTSPGSTGAGSTDGGIERDKDLRRGAYRYVFMSPAHVNSVLTFEVTREETRIERTVALTRSDCIRIIGFSPTSRAKERGVEVGDALLYYGAHRVRSVSDLLAAIAKTTITDAVTLTVLREGREEKLEVPGGRMGVMVENARTVP